MNGNVLKRVMWLAIIVFCSYLFIKVKNMNPPSQTLKAATELATETKKPVIHGVSKGVEITFGEYEGMPICLFLDHETGYAELRIDWVDGPSDYKATEYLKNEVDNILRSEQPVPLGTTGIKVKITGYPKWAPYHTLNKYYCQSDRILLSENYEFKDNLVVIHGSTNQPPGYYPYTLAKK